MANKEKSDTLDTIHYFLNDPNKLSDTQKKAVKDYFNNTTTGTPEQNSDGSLKKAARMFLMNFSPDTFKNSYVNRAYIDAGINPTVVNTLLKNPSAIDTMKIPDYEKKYFRNLLNIPINLNTDSLNLSKNIHTPGDPTSFIKNSYAKYLKSNNKSDTLKLSDNTTGSTDIGVFDIPNNYTPITPYNPMLPFTPILSNKGTSNTTENVTNKAVDQGTGNKTLTTPKYTPYTPVTIPGFSSEELIKNNPEFAMPKQEFSNNTGTKNPIGDSINKIENQNAKTETNQPVLTPEQIGHYYATQGAKKSVPNPKTALTEPQRDYYRYLTGYRRMAPNQAILSMGLDPNKYYY